MNLVAFFAHLQIELLTNCLFGSCWPIVAVVVDEVAVMFVEYVVKVLCVATDLFVNAIIVIYAK